MDYPDFAAIYRKKWRWDKISKGSHNVNCWYQRQCLWNVYVKDGIVWREEQSATYTPIDPGIPDNNPRGCQKGCSFSQRMYDGSRVRYPLKRVGERGEGKWKRVSWDEALEDIADRMIDVMIKEGPASMIYDAGTNAWGSQMLAGMRLAQLLDMPVLDINSEIGDSRPGISVVAGTEEMCNSAEDLMFSDLIFIWGGNPIYTQIPNAHYITEARYNGAKVITIAPDFSASAVHADQWVPVKVGSDAALGLSMAHVMIEEGIYKKRFVQEQTDLPLLQRVDNGRFLREADMEKGGSDEVFYLYDLRSRQILAASTQTLDLGEMDPALEGEFVVQTLAGEIRARPVFAGLREHLRQYRPEFASKICGVDPETIRGLARDLARARAASFLAQSNFGKFYHGLEMERAQVLCCVLAGQIGHKGAGYQGFPVLCADGFDVLAGMSGKDGVQQAIEALQKKKGAALEHFMKQGMTHEMAMYELGRQASRRGGSVPTMMWLYYQAGLDKLYGETERLDPYMKRSLSSYMEEAVAKGWQFKQDAPTKILINFAGNLLRRLRGFDQVQERLLPQLDLMVTIDFRMSNTAMQSDYVLPGAGWYEYDEVLWSTPLMPYVQVTTAAVKPVGESKDGFEALYLLAKHLQKRAAERGLTEFVDRSGKKRSFAVYDYITFGGEITEKDHDAYLELLLKMSTNVGGVTWAELKRKGYQRYTALGEQRYVNVGNATDVLPDKPIVAGTHHTEKKVPWPSLTRRLQFCIDHPLYAELGEVLPVHKDAPGFGGKHPIQLTGGHTRWSIHAAWIDHEPLLRLQRGEPVVFLNAADAEARGIQDGDTVKIFNDLSAVEFRACVAAAVRPGQAIVYHAWEAQQFKGKPYDSLFASQINPIHLAGGYGHLQVRPSAFSPGQHDRGTYVDVARVTDAVGQGGRDA
ncbi:molybdopterin-dependent oxidoreductase [Azoarcus sp. DN11]|uniref:molybdopterin-dependent oxidoreductase n=1 Tax=Azoarcus sp. DN11 TaxID=356837 RepID=UPI0013E3CE8F|nr:molybdopterin-dependent oxidoreductase [Azoarcus sp. DN11]